MSFSGGVYTLPGPALVTGEVVSATENNQFRNDVAGAFNLTMLRNGTSTATANLPMGGYKLTGLGVATTSGDALSYGQAATVSTLTATGAAALNGGITVDTSAFTVANTTGNTSIAGTLGVSGVSSLAESVISVNSSSDALRITQTGAGNALVVEDSANPDSTPFVINSGGRVLIGDTSDRNSLGYTGIQIQSNIVPGTWSNMSLNQWSATSTVGPTLLFNVSKGGIVGVQTSVSANNSLGWLRFSGSDGTNFVEGASIQAVVDGTPGTNDMPGRLVFSTTADGASSPTERLRIDSAGRCDMQTNMASGGGTGTASSISGTTLTVGGTVTGTFSVGDRVFGPNVEPNTFITGLGTGTGGAGTYTVSNSQTAASGVITSISGGNNVFRFTDTYTAVAANQPMGTIEWYNADASTPGAGVKAYIAGISESITPDSALIFGTSDNVASTQAVERWRIDSTGKLTAASEAGLEISKTSVTAPASTDGNVFSGTYTPTLTNTTNVASSTASSCHYMRVGSVVTVSGAVTIQPTATGNTVLNMSLPIASNFTGSQQLGGAGIAQNTTQAVSIYAATTTDDALFRLQAATTSSLVYNFSFTYRIL